MTYLLDRVSALQKKAVGDVHTGAMIALIPSVDDQLAMSLDTDDYSAEQHDELHVTLGYLGEAADISENNRMLILTLMQSIADTTDVFTTELNGIKVFNPTDSNDHTPCLVYGVSGPKMSPLYERVWNILTQVEGLRTPQQFTPWTPHITLTYFPNNSIDWGLVQKVGENMPPNVTFDRIRVAYAGRNIDFPLRTTEPMDDQPMESDTEVKPTTAYEKAMQLKVVRHVRTAGGVRRYDQPIGSVIVGDGHKLSHLKEVESEYHGYNAYDAGGKKIYTRKEGGKFTAYDDADNVIASDSSEERLLTALDTAAGKGKTSVPNGPNKPDPGVDKPGAKPGLTKTPAGGGPGFKKVESDYEGYDKYEGDNGKTYYSYKEGSQHVIVDEDDNHVATVGRSELLGKLHSLMKKDGDGKTSEPKKPTVSSGTGFKKVESDYEGYDKYEGDNGKTLYTSYAGNGKFAIVDEDDNELAKVNSHELVGKLGSLLKKDSNDSGTSKTKSNVDFEVIHGRGSMVGYGIQRNEKDENGKVKRQSLVGGSFTKRADAEARIERLKDMEKENPGSSDPKHPDYKPHVMGTDPRTGQPRKPVPKAGTKTPAPKAPAPKTNPNGSKEGPGGQGHLPADPDKVELTKPKDLRPGMMVNIGEGGWKYIGAVQKETRKSSWGAGRFQGQLEGQYTVLDPWGESIAIMSPNSTVEVDKGVPTRNDMSPKVVRRAYPDRGIDVHPADGVAGHVNPFEDNYPDFDPNSQKIYGKPIRYEHRVSTEREIGPLGYQTGRTLPSKVTVVRRERDKTGNWKETVLREQPLTGELKERDNQLYESHKAYQDLVSSERAKAGVGNYKPWKVPSQRSRTAKPAANTTQVPQPKTEAPVKAKPDHVDRSYTHEALDDFEKAAPPAAITETEALRNQYRDGNIDTRDLINELNKVLDKSSDVKKSRAMESLIRDLWTGVHPHGSEYEGNASAARRVDQKIGKPTAPGYVNKMTEMRQAVPAKMDFMEGRTSVAERSQYDAVKRYTGDEFSDLNEALRNDKLGSYRRWSDEIDKVMAQSKTTEPIEVKRGIRDVSKLFGEGNLVGKTYTDKAFVSTTPDATSAGVFARMQNNRDGAILTILAPKGTGAVMIGGNENEILLNRGLKYEIVKDIPASGKNPRQIVVEVV